MGRQSSVHPSCKTGHCAKLDEYFFPSYYFTINYTTCIYNFPWRRYLTTSKSIMEVSMHHLKSIVLYSIIKLPMDYQTRNTILPKRCTRTLTNINNLKKAKVKSKIVYHFYFPLSMYRKNVVICTGQ